jgi:hypothetical protein
MVLALLVLATPRIGPPPNVCPLKPELEFGLEPEDDDPDEVEFPDAPDGLPEDELPESPFRFCTPPVC